MGMPVIQPGTITREESVADIISAIAHILNAESEKLQAIINMPDTNALELMAANKSVKTAVDTVIQLELSTTNTTALAAPWATIPTSFPPPTPPLPEAYPQLARYPSPSHLRWGTR